MNLALRRHIEEIVSLTDAEAEYVASFFTLKTLKKHQFLVQQDSYVDHEYFVISGLLKASYTSEDGKEHIVQFAMENWWVTDYQAYITQGKSTLNIDCIEAVQLLSLSSSNKAKLCAELHKMEHFFRVKSISGYVALQKRIISLLSTDARLRYVQLFEQYPALFQRVPKSLIAAYLGVSRETLSRFSDTGI